MKSKRIADLNPIGQERYIVLICNPNCAKTALYFHETQGYIIDNRFENIREYKSKTSAIQKMQRRKNDGKK